ncbi:hypothetical protein DL762_001947 [Monosporascus cannonballus]|uniref:Uncharacterized protein n=1 Tax=Monosporascus cannonballus TaxID=155416 RepID=A0ABY0HEX0_9PEZI|nr:hypothetical protein DL762_001947 [Monosporascus cannonballus]RYO91993.1 hypothetical protein DL763_004837 [Monosporascus cannonballus]
MQGGPMTLLAIETEDWANKFGGNATSMPAVEEVGRPGELVRAQPGPSSRYQRQGCVLRQRDGRRRLPLQVDGRCRVHAAAEPRARFQSDPSVVALGADNRLTHQALLRGMWSPGWEDIGLDVAAANSAPQLIRYGTEPIQTDVFVISADDDLLFATWNVTQDESRGTTLCASGSLGGNLTTDWFDAGADSELHG